MAYKAHYEVDVKSSRQKVFAALMDFGGVQEQVKQGYGCLRGTYIIPVYISLGMEHWIWIVTKDLDLSHPSLGQCYRHLVANNLVAQISRIEQIAYDDIDYIASGYTGNISSSSLSLSSSSSSLSSSSSSNIMDFVNETKKYIHQSLYENFLSYQHLAQMYETDTTTTTAAKTSG